MIQVQEKKEHDFILQDMRNDTVKVYFLNPRFLLDKDMQVNTVKLFSLQKEKSSMYKWHRSREPSPRPCTVQKDVTQQLYFLSYFLIHFYSKKATHR